MEPPLTPAELLERIQQGEARLDRLTTRLEYLEDLDRRPWWIRLWTWGIQRYARLQS